MSTKTEHTNVENTVNLVEQFSTILTTLTAFRSQITTLQNQVKVLEKNVKKQMKTYEKEAKKHKNKGNRKASGFAVGGPVSKELCNFMGKPTDSKLARTEVTQYLIQYIKDHNLQWAENRKIIKPDSKLKKLLKPAKNEDVTYFNLQKLMNKHFIKKSSNVAQSQ